MFLQLLATAVLVSGTISAAPYPYNSFGYHRIGWPEAPRYPDTCCQLMWQDIGLKDPLPDDYVPAGNFMGRNFAFLRNPNLAFPKSDQPGEPPNWLGATNIQKETQVYSILVNPNKCGIGWYKTRFFGELIPIHKEKFFPSLGHSKWGDFVKYQNIPGRCAYSNGGFRKMTSMTDSEWIEVSGLDLMYVDCKASILTMSSAKLFNMTYDEDVFKNLRQQPEKVIYHKKMMVNNSPMPSKANVEFQIETIDNATMNLMDSYSNVFKTGARTYNEYITKKNVGGNLGFNLFGITFGASAGVDTGTRDGSEHISTSDKSTAGAKEIFRSKSERKLFKFGQEIQIPPYSKVTVTAFSKPVRGQIPFSAIYELTPTNLLTIEVLEKTIAKYNPGEKMRRVGDKLHMTYNGFIEMDSGHEVDVDIQTVPLPGHSFDNYESNIVTYNLKPVKIY